MTKQPLVSILVANYNNGHYFKDCYNSLVKQTYQNWEVIIVDDCSTDNSVDVIKTLVGQDQRFKIYENNENKGAGYTKRRCAELANGEICGFVDPDDAIVESAIDVMVKKHQEEQLASLIYSQFYLCDENLNIQKPWKTKQVSNNSKVFFNFDGIISHFSSFKKAAYLKTEGIDSYLQRAVDQDLYLKLYEVADVLFLDEYLYMYRIHDGGISTIKNVNKANYWHWVAIIKAAERRNINIENLFVDNFVNRKDYDNISTKLELLKKSRLLKLLNKLGLFKAYNYL